MRLVRNHAWFTSAIHEGVVGRAVDVPPRISLQHPARTPPASRRCGTRVLRRPPSGVSVGLLEPICSGTRANDAPAAGATPPPPRQHDAARPSVAPRPRASGRSSGRNSNDRLADQRPRRPAGARRGELRLDALLHQALAAARATVARGPRGRSPMTQRSTPRPATRHRPASSRVTVNRGGPVGARRTAARSGVAASRLLGQRAPSRSQQLVDPVAGHRRDHQGIAAERRQRPPGLDEVGLGRRPRATAAPRARGRTPRARSRQVARSATGSSAARSTTSTSARQRDDVPKEPMPEPAALAARPRPARGRPPPRTGPRPRPPRRGWA